MNKTLALAMIGLAVAATPALAADSKEKKQTQKPAAKSATTAPANNQKTATTASKNKAADKGSQGGIILQNNQKASDKGAQGGIILQNNAAKSGTNTKAPATKNATPGG